MTLHSEQPGLIDGARPLPAIPRTALVTGAARRIGRCVALDLAAHGYAVAVHYNGSAEDADAVVAQIVSAGGRAVALAADLSVEAEVAALMPAATAALGPVGVLINNASTFEYDAVTTATRDSWDFHMEVNLRAPFVLSQALVAQLPDDAGGTIINLIDQRVWNLTPHFMTYTVSKAGLWTLTRTMAMALAPRIRVNAIGPGPTLASVHQDHEGFRAQCDKMPLRRGTSPAEIAAAIRFLIDAQAMTGQMLALDGGQHLGWAQAPHGSGPHGSEPHPGAGGGAHDAALD
ncbi:short chain dehydrogenase [Tistrella bauzanensis]|uniref:Short chain dehydrogenase n=1 Tax=Tistrella bauzanensis TaxID=657419 RepID=A0ABQ1I9C0_9PROT|nr:SDR family oxidoreductase [Tistrella bauzanensis]GGB24176.1 short chain dehydrogenase [Tistrella bauzanensis]